VGLLLFGLAFGLAEYFIAATVIALLLLIAAVQAARQKPHLKLEAGAGYTVRGETAQVQLRAYNPRYWPIFPLRLSLVLQKEGQAPVELAYYEIALKPRAETTLPMEVTCHHRGEYAVLSHPYYAEDVFGFFALPCAALPPLNLVSLPKTNLTPPEEHDSALLEIEENLHKQPWHHGQLTAESRTYQHGDTMRSIHWKKSASRRALMSRLREHTADSFCCLLLDNRPWGEGEQALDYEDRLCEAALSFLYTQLTGSKPITLLPGNLSLQSAENMDKAAELLATLPFDNEAIYGELKSLLENPHLPTELYLALAQPPAPLLPLLKEIINRGCPVVLLAPTTDAELVKSGLELALPVVAINSEQ
jgi:uncharacterized protein (DUF58 family)